MTMPSLRFISATLLTTVALTSLPGTARAQGDDELAGRAWRSARALAADGKADSALAQYDIARVRSEAIADYTMISAALTGAAQVHDVFIGCADSALILMKAAVAAAGPGDRQAANALVRLLASRGSASAPEAQRVLDQAYASVENLGRSITRESMNWHQGLAAVQMAQGRETAALASLNSALEIATRLRSGDATDSVATPGDDINPLNYWILYDLAQLRLNARSTAVANTAAGNKLMDALVNAGIGLDEQDEIPVPSARLFETLTLLAHECKMNGGSCKPPTRAKCTRTSST